MAEDLSVWCGELGTFLAYIYSIIFGNLTFRIKSLGDSSGGDTPGYIPNPAVKPTSADGTWAAAPWESRSLPRDFIHLKLTNIRPRGIILLTFTVVL